MRRAIDADIVLVTDVQGWMPDDGTVYVYVRLCDPCTKHLKTVIYAPSPPPLRPSPPPQRTGRCETRGAWWPERRAVPPCLAHAGLALTHVGAHSFVGPVAA